MILAAELLFLQKVTLATVNAKVTALNSLYAAQPGYAAVPAVATIADGQVYGPLDTQVVAPALLYIIGAGEGPLGLKANQRSDLSTRYEILYISQQDTFANAKRDSQVMIEAMLFVLETIEGFSLGTSPDRGVVLILDPTVELVSIDATVGTTAATKYGFRWRGEFELRLERSSTL